MLLPVYIDGGELCRLTARTSRGGDRDQRYADSNVARDTFSRVHVNQLRHVDDAAAADSHDDVGFHLSIALNADFNVLQLRVLGELEEAMRLAQPQMRSKSLFSAGQRIALPSRDEQHRARAVSRQHAIEMPDAGEA